MRRCRMRRYSATELVKVRHSRHSKMRLGEARPALAVVHTIADDFAAQVAELTATTVTDRQWAAFLDAPTRSRRSVAPTAPNRNMLRAVGGGADALDTPPPCASCRAC